VWAFSLLAALSLCACLPVQPTVGAPPAPAGGNVVSQPPTATSVPSPRPEETVIPSLQPTRLPATATLPATPAVCSPLDGIEAGDLAGHIVNPFHPPPPGSDDPHQGVDLADLIPGSGIARAGRRVQAVLAGRVAGVIRDRFPYGNAILVETPLEGLPAGWLEALPVPTPAPTLPARSALTCPTPQAPQSWDLARRSLYLLYAHMQAAPSLQPGGAVACGEELGAVGSSGNALNPHLHLEARVGPSGADFASMAHYDASASPDEMRAYCDWRVSGLFQLIDPMRFFAAAP
jgi:murein DD-endopeptidase MepM/ murein hydrolase activator NlpD